MYRTTTDQRSQQQIDALPAVALAGFAEARAALEQLGRVDLLDVLWIG